MRAWGPTSAAYPALARTRRRRGPGLLVLALLVASPAVDACGGKVSGGGTTNTAGGNGGVGLAAPLGGGTNGDSGGSLTSGGVSESGGAATGTGAASGGTATGGSLTGGTGPVPVCSTVASLPTMGTSCNTVGESLCDASGNQCVCARGIWHCSTSCASTDPEPAPASACVRGAACNYPSGVSCDCLNSSWMCMGGSSCPVDMPGTGNACNGLTGMWCDYPNSNPALHFACGCSPNASTGSSWTCVQAYQCPATQPAYDLTNTCAGVAFCRYGATRCTCGWSGTPWICGLWILGFIGDTPPPDAGTGGTTGSGGAPTGGTATGGVVTGGTATGGSATAGTASVPVCSTAASLPSMGTVCRTAGESLCDASGSQCVCFRGIWYCNTSCASTYPVEPAPGSACVRGAACNYPSGVGCNCINSSWWCIGGSACPADVPENAGACDGLTGMWCDYPNEIPALHPAAFCSTNADASTGSSWTVVQSGLCPATQPAYDLTAPCEGPAFCSYGSTRCHCASTGEPWICGLGLLLPGVPN